MLKLALILLPVLAQAAVEPVVSGDSARGARIFEQEQCVKCHSVNGRGGKMGADFGRLVSRSYTPAQLASTMWNHAPVMWGAMEAAGIERPHLSAGDAADLFAYFYSARFFDQPGDAARGKATFAAKHCGDCHGVSESRAEGAPPIARWESLADPVVMVQQMWNHSARMQDAFARRGIVWQELTTAQLNDMAAWLRSLPETRHLASRFSNTSDRDGYRIFEAKGCVKCHVGKLALENRLHDMTLTDIAVDMWNHAPRMVKPTPSLTQEEMRELLSFLWMRQFVYPAGDKARGRAVFHTRHCADCHAGGTHGAPQLPGQARHYSEVAIMSAIWSHGPQMLNRMKQAGIGWPRFKSPQELGDLLAYLNSVQ
ncbi:MAG TPA: c-type cytochrome [Bryobacteraceae bacterium]|jgi:mono/diheme cytochrome c family protein|nr:c-type cytochrome [Bryobacteraceae bacterium]